jgi:outer membrane protein OmpA-like peptidoglycan-associated protein
MHKFLFPALAASALAFAACDRATPAENAEHDQAQEATKDTAVVFRSGQTADQVASRTFDLTKAKLADVKLPEIKNSGITVRGDSSYQVYSIDETVLFDTDKATVKPSAAASLQEIIGSIGKRYAGKQVEVMGFADSRGDAKYNMQLGQERANAVKNYLVETGKLPAANVSTESFGEQKPTASNATAAGRQENRRVEIAVQTR